VAGCSVSDNEYYVNFVGDNILDNSVGI
jgi:hypothetical protein